MLRIYDLKVDIYNRNSKFIAWLQFSARCTALPGLMVIVHSNSNKSGQKYFNLFLPPLLAPQEKKSQGFFSYGHNYKGYRFINGLLGTSNFCIWPFSAVSGIVARLTADWGINAQTGSPMPRRPTVRHGYISTLGGLLKEKRVDSLERENVVMGAGEMGQ